MNTTFDISKNNKTLIIRCFIENMSVIQGLLRTKLPTKPNSWKYSKVQDWNGKDQRSTPASWTQRGYDENQETRKDIGGNQASDRWPHADKK